MVGDEVSMLMMVVSVMLVLGQALIIALVIVVRTRWYQCFSLRLTLALSSS